MLLGMLVAGGCAGADAEALDGARDLGTFIREEPVRGILYVEVADADGTPLQPETVEISLDGDAIARADCMESTAGLCRVWVGELEAFERVTAWATTCGHRFGATVALGPEVDESDPFEAAVTIVGVPNLCDSVEPAP